MVTTYFSQMKANAILVVFSVICVFAFTACASNPQSRTVGTTIDDAVITSSIKSSLIADDLVHAFDIDVDTHRGTVMLSGFVETQNQIDRAVEIANRAKGVQKVINKLETKPKAISQSN